MFQLFLFASLLIIFVESVKLIRTCFNSFCLLFAYAVECDPHRLWSFNFFVCFMTQEALEFQFSLFASCGYCGWGLTIKY
jgi:hypothetical protein